MKAIQAKPSSVLVRPRITEKAALKADKENVYVFEVTKNSTKKQIAAAIKDTYKKTPLSIRMVTIPTKPTFIRGKAGTKGGGKKAYVYMKKGDKIEIM